MHNVHVVLLVLAGLIFLGSLICGVIIVIDAFNYETWMGILSLLVPPFFAYYALFEFEHENKWWLVLGAIGGSSLAGLLFKLGMGLPFGIYA